MLKGLLQVEVIMQVFGQIKLLQIQGVWLEVSELLWKVQI